MWGIAARTHRNWKIGKLELEFRYVGDSSTGVGWVGGGRGISSLPASARRRRERTLIGSVHGRVARLSMRSGSLKIQLARVRNRRHLSSRQTLPRRLSFPFLSFPEEEPRPGRIWPGTPIYGRLDRTISHTNITWGELCTISAHQLGRERVAFSPPAVPDLRGTPFLAPSRTNQRIFSPHHHPYKTPAIPNLEPHFHHVDYIQTPIDSPSPFPPPSLLLPVFSSAPFSPLPLSPLSPLSSRFLLSFSLPPFHAHPRPPPSQPQLLRYDVVVPLLRRQGRHSESDRRSSSKLASAPPPCFLSPHTERDVGNLPSDRTIFCDFFSARPLPTDVVERANGKMESERGGAGEGAGEYGCYYYYYDDDDYYYY